MDKKLLAKETKGKVEGKLKVINTKSYQSREWEVCEKSKLTGCFLERGRKTSYRTSENSHSLMRSKSECKASWKNNNNKDTTFHNMLREQGFWF